MASLGSTSPNTFSKHNQRNLIDELLARLTTQLPSCLRLSPSLIATAADIVFENGVIVESFFKNDEGHNVTVSGDRYRAMVTNFFLPELNNHDVQELWFHQDGATCHTDRATIDLLKDTFGDRLISHFGPVNWPPRSCDLTPLDFFLWGYVKSLVYADKPQTLDHLEDNIRRVIADIRPQMLEKVIENWTSRLDYIRASRGSHMPEIIFKLLEVGQVQNEGQRILSFPSRKATREVKDLSQPSWLTDSVELDFNTWIVENFQERE
ncbi:transposable element Tc3 transposase [Trichonephila clavipes]|nr:transposable element Tc3 transposase [Trichonephila clavipes]